MQKASVTRPSCFGMRTKKTKTNIRLEKWLKKYSQRQNLPAALSFANKLFVQPNDSTLLPVTIKKVHFEAFRQIASIWAFKTQSHAFPKSSTVIGVALEGATL
jgi:hypothetical protein